MTDRYNAFISYAWRDNQPFQENGQGWVSVLADRLNKLLSRELPRAFSQDTIWLDYEKLRGGNRVSDTIRERLHQSRLLIPILSKGWLDSPWCRDELEIFLGQHGPDSKRLFPVWMEPVQGLPAPLDDLLKYKFWYQDEKKQPRTRWFPDPDPTDRDYGRILQDFAQDLAARLEVIAKEESPEPLGTPAKPAAPVRPEGQHVVLVNGGDDDWELVRAVARRLDKDHGLGYVLPLRQGSGLKSSDVDRDLRDKLGLCDNVLLVYHKGPEHQVHRYLTDTLRAIPRRPKSAPPLNITLCHPRGSEFGFKLPCMRVLECSGAALDDCARQLAGLLV
uniref:TIR domain-containing protein n=1 Tax=Candidatus Kentrum sp. FM TaxID=2126340 RepID=A0A450VWW2_9GAMM|nr:MAG: TIR domain-containing protein [Candidatus Kentron sp. FM]VFJ65453.1 MAG: TIR domain-containing protein [Candidatus Kentron sp. FM]VFK09301.1 MAG: TIR domain-containing protein [Candidatus Kentron sp. FM]